MGGGPRRTQAGTAGQTPNAVVASLPWLRTRMPLAVFSGARALITECVIHPGTKLNTCVAMGRGTVGVTARPAVAEDLQALRRVHVSRLGGVGREADFESNFLCWWLNSRRYSFIFPTTHTDNTR